MKDQVRFNAPLYLLYVNQKMSTYIKLSHCIDGCQTYNRSQFKTKKEYECDCNDNGTLKRWPKWVEEGTPSPTGRYTFWNWRLWK